MRCVVGGKRSSERRPPKDERVCRSAARGALGSSRRARGDDGLPLQWQRTRRRERDRSGNPERRSRSQSCATRREEMCQGLEERGFDRSAGGARRSLGGAGHTSGGSSHTERGARHVTCLSRRAAGGLQDGERGALRCAVGALRFAVPEGRGVRLARVDPAPSVRSAERPLLREAGAHHTVGRPRGDERGACHSSRGAPCLSGGARRSARGSLHGARGPGDSEGGARDLATRRGAPRSP